MKTLTKPLLLIAACFIMVAAHAQTSPLINNCYKLNCVESLPAIADFR